MVVNFLCVIWVLLSIKKLTRSYIKFSNMSTMTEFSTNLKLSAYCEIVKCYEHLHKIIRTPQTARQPIDVLNNIRILQDCSERIQNIVDMELETNFYADDDFYNHLYLVREHICNLAESERKLGVGVFPLSVSAPSQPTIQPMSATPTAVQKPNEEDQLKTVILSTRVEPKVRSLQDVAGLSDVKKQLTAVTILPLKQPQLYIGQKICNSILLYGPPGTGKTRTVHALAAEMSACLFSVNSSDIFSHYVGQTEKMVTALFKTVKEPRPCSTVLFIDEIDGMCKRRHYSESDWNRRFKTELMCQLSNFEDCPNVFLICATNCPWDLDPAFYRRFQQHIYVPLPNRPERYELLRLLTKNTSLQETSNYWGQLLCKTEGYSGSDMTNLVRYALNIPLMELTNITMWQPVGDNMYKPAEDTENFENIIFRELHEMPSGSIQARSAEVFDLIAAADTIKRTVSDLEMHKFAAFTNQA